MGVQLTTSIGFELIEVHRTKPLNWMGKCSTDPHYDV